jgi:predicted glutamine amidotransferase
MGGLVMENTHPFCLGPYSFGHNGTILHFPRLLEYGVPPATGSTDTEHFFNYFLSNLDRRDVAGSLRGAVTAVIERSPFSGLNFIFSDGEKLYAYKLGIFELHWLHRPGQLLVSSEELTDEPWHCVSQDVLLTLDPNDVEEPKAQRLVGDVLVERAEIVKFTEGHELRGEERGQFAAERAARMAAAE